MASMPPPDRRVNTLRLHGLHGFARFDFGPNRAMKSFVVSWFARFARFARFISSNYIEMYIYIENVAEFNRANRA